jgi:hypothetical protein
VDLYIYYRVAVVDAERLKEAVGLLHSRLHTFNNTKFGLKRAVNRVGGLDTWMEIYLSVTEEFTTLLETTIATTELSGLIVGERHTEYFLDSLSCV